MPRAADVALICLALWIPGCSGSGPGTKPGDDAQAGGDAEARPDGTIVLPRLIPGGGVADGPLRGTLMVHVVEVSTDAPIAGAAVRVGEPDAAPVFEGTTDLTGQVGWAGPALESPQIVTVTAAGHVAATWLGVNGANVTIPLGARPAPPVDTATVSGTIAGWDTMASPGMGSYRAALVGYAHTDNPLDPANGLPQPTDGQGTPLNLCVFSPFVAEDPCQWTLTARTGPVALYATIVHGDPNGTPNDVTDDTLTVEGYALLTGLDLAPGQSLTGQELTPVADLTDLTLSFPAAPAGLEDVLGVPYLVLGEEGRLPVYVLRPDAPAAPVPALTGGLAGARYAVTALATPPGDADTESSISLLPSVALGAPVALPAWLPRPAGLTAGAAGAGPYGFGAVAGASLYTAAFADAQGEVAWIVMSLDGRTTFGLPALAPDPLPAGSLALSVTALVMPGFDAADFTGSGLAGGVTQTSTARLEFTR